MLALAGAAFLMFDAGGRNLIAPESASENPASATARSDALPRVLGALAAVLVAGRLLGLAFRRFGQPPVIGEVVAGIVLGPSLLGRVWPEATELLLPASVAPTLGVIAQLGVVLYMFLVGLELNPGLLRERARTTLLIAHAGMIVPFVLGAGLALILFPRLATRDTSFTSFALFLGVAMSVTAFPVLARILADHGMSKSPLGVLALGCAAVGDATAWCALAVVAGAAQARLIDAVRVVLLNIGFAAVMLVVVRPFLQRFLARVDDEVKLTPGVTAIILTGLLLSALATELIGIHALFGAFLFGAIIPHDGPVARALMQKMEDLVTVLLLPAFFAFTGLRTQIGLVSGGEAWLLTGLIIATATLGKFGGTFAAARLSGMGMRESAGLGALMNTRGLMELIVLNVGLDLKIISPPLFAMMVLMALATTLATGPIMRWLTPRPGDERRGEWVTSEPER